MPVRRRPISGPVRLTSARKLGVYAVGAGIWVTGAVWLLLRYFFRQKSEFGFESNPAEPWMLRLHGAFAFAALVAMGLLWGVHVLNGWYSRRRRWSGALIFGLSCFLGLSGYLLYYAGEDDFRDVVSISHWVVGLAAIGFFLWHRFWAERKSGDDPVRADRTFAAPAAANFQFSTARRPVARPASTGSISKARNDDRP